MKRSPLRRKAKPKRVKKPTRTSLKRKADKLAGDRCRARGFCEMKVLKPELVCKPPLQWCHIVRRGYHSTRWDDDNSLCGCSAHHTYFTNHTEAWFLSFEKQWPGRYQELWDRAQVPWDGDYDKVFSALVPLSVLQGLHQDAPK